MKIQPHIILLCILLPGYLFAQGGQSTVKDEPYTVPQSVKYAISDKHKDVNLKKLVIDGDNSVFILTNLGLFRDYPGNIISKDLIYSSLADKKPVDICIQEEKEYLYYLYPDRFLTNKHAGTICGHLPLNKYSHIAVNKDDDVLLVGKQGAILFNRSNKLKEFSIPQGEFVKLYVSNNTFWYLCKEAVFVLENDKWNKLHEGKNLTALAFSGNNIAVGTTDGYYVIDKKGNSINKKNNRLPVPAITNMLTVKDRFWFATDDGAFVKQQKNFDYYASKRWLDQNRVIDMAADKNGNLFFLTSTGLNKVEFVEETLADKANYMQDNLRKYHLRYGFSAESRLTDPNDPTSIRLDDSDNDGLWTSFYLGSQAFRYAVTKEEKAKEYVWESFEPFERLIVIHPITGFSARTFERTGYIAGDTVPWRPAPDKDWWWKGTTSTDEFVAYLFVTAVIDQFVATTAEEKKRVADYFDAIMTHIISNDYYFIDYDGKPTLWGRWNPEYVNSFATTQFDRRLNSTLTITGLQLAYKLTNKEIYKTEAYRMMKEHGYLENMKIPMNNIKFTSGFQHDGITMGEDWNHSDDEMAFLTYWVLYHYAFDNQIKEEYAKMIRDHWEIEKPERNALWNLLTYGTSGDIDLESTIWYLQGFPKDRTRYEVKNSHRKDIELMPVDLQSNFRDQKTKELLPKRERPMNRHNNNEFFIDGGRGSSRTLSGDEYLLPYWMARYLKVIK
ncbi:ligand-binding sensor domain-containing protein [Massilibacteroides vaginae]|uniref:hypothetical protein n=1 Tax=Massilibacteroides vaginae TaxID=1673718 RepID=UPI000A1CDCDC|nr:hypothetical protein [Massilibacteroides vaginae]